MAAVFDAYVMVDWSASSAPKTGADSIWWCSLERRDGVLTPSRLANPSTRRRAVNDLADLLSDLVARDRATLIGFDFAFGYPTGFAGKLRPEAPTWNSVWSEITSRVRDDEDNTNNRFDVAAALNRRISGGAFPFWGCPETATRPTLTRTKPGGYGADTLVEFRLAERIATGPRSVWQLAYAGSVGSQTLLGIPCLRILRHHPWLADRIRIWPFETGLKAFASAGGQPWRMLLAEVYPSMVPLGVPSNETKDAAQVDALARHFADLDAHDRLAPLFAGPAELSEAERQTIETEEGWILGIETVRSKAATASGGRYDYLRDPAEIYRRSFEAIRSAARLDHLPADIEPLAVRLIHACGMPDIVGDLAFSPDAATAAREAMRAGAPVFVDTEMVAAGIIRDRLPAGNEVICTLGDPIVAEAARRSETTRSAAAVDLWRPRLDSAIVAIGNAPTALFRLLELIDAGGPLPAVILGFPVGFVGAAESKAALIDHAAGVPYVSVRGRRGGSAFAAAAVNALAGGDG